MDQYKVVNENEEYFVEADSKNKARKEVMKIEGITIEKVELEEVGDTTGGWIYLEQDDLRWADVKMGNTTLGRAGCLVTSLSMMSYWYGDYFTPKQIAEKSKFTKEGYYYWKSGDDYLPFTFVWRYYTRDIGKILDILNSKDNACVVRATGDYTHWLAVIGYDKEKGLVGADPLSGEAVFIEERYGRIDGFAEITRKK